MARRIDDNAEELMRQLLYLMYLRTASWADTSIPIPVTEIKEAMKKNFPSILPYLDQYLRIIGNYYFFKNLYILKNLYICM
jgi:DNA-directed RNA polymerase III subunit RPC3